MTTVAFCEIEPFCRSVLRKHWPHVPIYDDVRELTAARLRADGIAVDVICGGFPCQDVSRSGRGAGMAGARSGLWSHYCDLICELRPQFVIVENVAALLDGGAGRVLGDLAEIGYDAEWHCIPAASVGAEHERDRIWIVSYPHVQHGEARMGVLTLNEATLRAARDRNRASVWLASTLPPPRVVDGSAIWMDRRQRTEAIGNAVVPQIPELIGRAIMSAA